jgi:hypothetical protein
MKLLDILKESLEPKKQGCSCGCNSCDKAPKLLDTAITLSEGLTYHITNKKPITETLYRYGSEAHIKLIMEVRDLWEEGRLQLTEDDLHLFEETDLGLVAEYEGKKVLLDYPLLENELDEAKHQGKEVQLNKPKRGGPKKFYVYVRKPGGGIKKVAFGAKEGGGNLAVKINDRAARQAFATRHKCAQANDRTTPKYWSCRLPRYAKALGLKSNFTGFW